jgi:hypothetical protein
MVGTTLAVIIAGFIFFQGKSQKVLTASDIAPIISSTESAFTQAESKVLKAVPDDDIEPLGPNPDVNKCICKGTGKIVQGDGHKTDCPYHSASSPAPAVNEVEVLEMRTYCPTETTQIQKKNYRRPLLWFLRRR